MVGGGERQQHPVILVYIDGDAGPVVGEGVAVGVREAADEPAEA